MATVQVLEKSRYGAPSRVQIDRFHFHKVPDSPFFRCSSPGCKSRILVFPEGDSFVSSPHEESFHDHKLKNSFFIHLEYGKTRFSFLWYFNYAAEVVFKWLMWHYFRKVVKDIIGDDLEDDLERIVCSLRRVKRSGKRETVAELEKETPQDGDEYVFFYRPTTALRPETGDTVIVYTKAMEKKKNSGPQMNHADDEPRDEATGPNQNSTSKPSEEFETGRSATSALHLKYGSAQPSESGEFSLLEFAETVRHLFPVVAKLISATIDSRERLLAKLRQIAVFDFSERILGSFLLNGSSHVVRQTVTLEKMTLASVEGEFYLPKNICNASVCRCSYHFYCDRPCPQLFHFNHCKVCQRARRYHFYIKNCSGIPLESVKIEAIVMGTKVDSLWKMHKELQEIFARFANFLAEESSDLKEEKWSNLEEIEADVKKVFSYRSMQNEFSKCFQSLQEINY